MPIIENVTYSLNLRDRSFITSQRGGGGKEGRGLVGGGGYNF